MKKLIFPAALLSITLICSASSLTLVSCQDKTKEKLEDATDAVGTEVEQKIDTVGQKIDTLSQKIETAADTVKSKTKKVVEKGAEKVEEGAKKIKDAIKK